MFLYLEGCSSSNSKSFPLNITKNIYRSASKLHETRTYSSPSRSLFNRDEEYSLPNEEQKIISNETYDSPKVYNETQSIDRNNNHILESPIPCRRTKKDQLYESTM